MSTKKTIKPTLIGWACPTGFDISLFTPPSSTRTVYRQDYWEPVVFGTVISQIVRPITQSKRTCLRIMRLIAKDNGWRVGHIRVQTLAAWRKRATAHNDEVRARQARRAY